MKSFKYCTIRKKTYISDMGKSWQHLHELVQNLSPAEKGYFKKHWNGFSENTAPKSLEVFDLLVRMKTFNESKIKTSFAGSASALKSLRTHLYKQILRSLRLFNQDTDLGFTLREYLDYIEILRKKGLHEQSIPFLNKGKTLSFDMNMHPYQVLFLIQQKQFLNQYPETDKTIIAQQISKNIIAASDLIVNREVIKLAHVKSIYWNNVFVPLRDEEVVTESNKLLVTLLAIDESTIEDYSERNLLYAALSNIYLLHGNIKQAIVFQQKSVVLMEAMDVRKINKILSYVSALYNLASLFIYLKDFKQVDLQIQKIKKVELSFKTEIQFVNSVTCCLEAQLLQHNNSKFSEKKLVTIENTMGEDQPIPNLYYDTKFALLSYCIKNKQYKAALERSHDLVTTKYMHSQISFHVHVRLLHILVHYKNNNMQLLPFLIRSTYRFMLKQELNYQIEKSLLRFFRKILTKINRTEILTLFQQLLNEIIAIAENPAEARVMLIYFNYSGWLESELKDN
ncbi:MAG: hypothetical protein IPO03_06995 [Bacteroidetes bacterium]|nr:hypothetical protein [Bacteroidota bacterium]